ncbi:MAG: biotin--[acetyl-CoA-carboxylase] ligase [Sphingopyxis sp.]
MTNPSLNFVPETGSTNADLAALFAAGNPLAEATWLIADRQTSGRGRLGRMWHDGAGNFMGSTLVRLRRDDPPAHSLALVTALCVTEALDSVSEGHPSAPHIQIKWPNDIMVGGAKIAGILLERHGDYVVIGAGVNLTSAPPLDDRATIALGTLGITVARNDFASVLAQKVATALVRWRSGDWPDRVIADWLARAHCVGTPLTLTEGEHAGMRGAFDGLNQDGSLILRLANGSVTAIHAGEVRLSMTSDEEGTSHAAGD